MTDTQKNEMVKAEDVGKIAQAGYGPLEILRHVSLEIKKAESVAIVGPSGSGKTTLLGLLAGLDVPTTGRIWLAGRELTDMREEERARIRGACVGFVFQNFQLLSGLTALENTMLPMELRGDRQARIKSMEVLERVGLVDRSDHYPQQLSGGECQRVAIARAFASTPEVLFADEPTGNLDTHTGRRVSDLLFALNQEVGATLVLVTHDERLAARTDRILYMEAGTLL